MGWNADSEWIKEKYIGTWEKKKKVLLIVRLPLRGKRSVTVSALTVKVVAYKWCANDHWHQGDVLYFAILCCMRSLLYYTRSTANLTREKVTILPSSNLLAHRPQRPSKTLPNGSSES